MIQNDISIDKNTKADIIFNNEINAHKFLTITGLVSLLAGSAGLIFTTVTGINPVSMTNFIVFVVGTLISTVTPYYYGYHAPADKIPYSKYIVTASAWISWAAILVAVHHHELWVLMFYFLSMAGIYLSIKLFIINAIGVFAIANFVFLYYIPNPNYTMPPVDLIYREVYMFVISFITFFIVRNAKVVLAKAIESEHESKELNNKNNLIMENMKKTVDALNNSSRDVLISINEIQQAMNQVVSTTTESASQSGFSKETIISMNDDLKELMELSSQTVAMVDKTEKNNEDIDMKSHKGIKMVEDLLSKMKEVQSDSENTAKLIQSFQEKIKNIDEVISFISDIAEQTNLLSLNASIEAARAGDQGKGFAVVANEVRNLSSQSTKAVDSIRSFLTEIKNSSFEIREVIDGNVSKINEGLQLTHSSSDNFLTISQGIKESVINMKKTLENIKFQDKSIEESVENLQQIEDIVKGLANNSETIAASTEEVLASIDMIGDSINNLNKLVKSLNN